MKKSRPFLFLGNFFFFETLSFFSFRCCSSSSSSSLSLENTMDPSFAANLEPREFAAFYTMGKMAAFMSRDCEDQILQYGNCLQGCVEDNMSEREQAHCIETRCMAFAQSGSKCLEVQSAKAQSWFTSGVQPAIRQGCKGGDVFDPMDNSPISNPRECNEVIRRAFDRYVPEDEYPHTQASAILLSMMAAEAGAMQ